MVVIIGFVDCIVILFIDVMVGIGFIVVAGGLGGPPGIHFPCQEYIFFVVVGIVGFIIVVGAMVGFWVG